MASIGRLLAGLDETGADVTGQEAAEALWLALHMDGSPEAVAPPVPSPGSPRQGSTAGTPARGAGSRDPAGPTARPVPGRLSSRGPGTSHAGPGGRAAPPKELRRPLELQRGLRALARTVRTGPAVILDEETTATQSAEAGTVIPVLLPAARRWLSLALVIDGSPSMALWNGLASELHAVLAQLGAFRAISAWTLRFRGSRAVICARAAQGPDGPPRSPRELLDPAGQQAIMVLSDCAGDPWRSGAAMQVLDRWAHAGPLAIVSPLSQRLWPRSALACHYVRLRAPFPGAPNHRLSVDPPGGPLSGAERAGVPIPILATSPGWFASWSRLVSGPGRAHAMTAFTGAAPAGDTDAPALDGERVVRQFMAGASAGAFRLAGLLSAATPLSLPVMRLVQRELLPGTGPEQLAEVYLGGVLRSVLASGPGGAGAAFEFQPGVRELLLGTILRSEAVQVAELVSAAAEAAAAGGPRGSAGLVPAAVTEPPPGSAELVPATAGARSAEVPRTEVESLVLRRIGRTYARAAGLAATPVVMPRSPEPKRPGPPVHADQPPLAAQMAIQTPQVPQRAQEPAFPPGRPYRTPAEAAAPVASAGVTMWGAPRSGKTTFLAALSIALTRQAGPWVLTGADEPSTSMLVSLTSDLAQRRFPRATVAMEECRWLLEQLPEPTRRRLRRQQASPRTAISLDLVDASGELYSPSSTRYPESRGDLISRLEQSRGIIFVFDPVREHQYGDAFEHAFGMLAELASRMRASDVPGSGRLPHFVALCITKFDHVRVVRTAEELDLLTQNPRDQYGFPQVDDEDAEELLSALATVSRDRMAELMLATLRQHFRPDRIRVFVTSSIGFYVDQRAGVFDPDDYQNEVPDADEPSGARVRGAVHPINVAEPVIWLAGKLASQPAG